MPNSQVDWTQAPADADAWSVDVATGVTCWWSLEILDITTMADPLPKARHGWVSVGDKPAPQFGWQGSAADSFTLRPLPPLP